MRKHASKRACRAGREWDHRNRLAKATIYTSSAQTTKLKEVSYGYDAFDARVAKTVTPYSGGVAGTPTKEIYVWDQGNPSGVNNVLFDFVDPDGGGWNPTLKTRYLDGNAVDQVLAQEDVTTGETLWLLQDNLGSVREVVNNDLDVINRIVYDAFGEITSVTDPSAGGVATVLVSRASFTGQEYDADTGLYYYSAGKPGGRWLDPKTRTFLSPDTAGLDVDPNLYRYVNSSPTNFIDPSGRSKQIEQTILQLAAKGDIESLKLLLATGGLAPKYAQMVQNAINRLQPGAQRCLAQTHHIATTFGQWGIELQKIFARAGMSTNDPENKMPLISHCGRHIWEYHQYVFARLNAAVGSKTGDAAKRALVNALNQLRAELQHNPRLPFCDGGLRQ